jgi:glycosyltransferase involved in cell wall biosynthesis
VNADRPVVLVLSDYYLPGFRAGGPIRTLHGIVDSLSDEFEFKVVTRDRDLGMRTAYPDIVPNQWLKVGAAQVMYLSPPRLVGPTVRKLISVNEHGALYINSWFSVPFAIQPLMLRRLGLLPRRPLIIAPRGEMAWGALQIHPARKWAYVELAKISGLANEAIWHASSPHEVTDIRRRFRAATQVVIAPDLALATDPSTEPHPEKTAGKLRLLFLGRVSRMKNLDGALRFLRGVEGEIRFSIYGPIEDSAYWRQCQELISQLPSNVDVRYGGEVSPDHVPEVIAAHDVLFQPSLGENFGHAILEALLNARPVVISDRTRYRGLEAEGVGWDVALEKPERYREVLQACVAMNAAEWRKLSEAARNYAHKMLSDPESLRLNRMLFRTSLRRQPLHRHPDGRKEPPAMSHRDS